MNTRKLGRRGETIAADFLTTKGYEILERNFWSKYGEIDLIAQEGPDLVFIEVKAAQSESLVKPKEKVTYQKQQHLKQVAYYYLLKHNNNCNCRFDIVAISGWERENQEIELIKNAFLVD